MGLNRGRNWQDRDVQPFTTVVVNLRMTRVGGGGSRKERKQATRDKCKLTYTTVMGTLK